MQKILQEIRGNRATITINNPDQMNCLDLEMLDDLKSILQDIKKDKTARVILITGAGEKAFSTGGNLKVFRKLKEFHEVKDWIVFGNEVFNLLEKITIPTIAAIRGYAIGGGLELAMACDLRIATEGAVFSMPELSLGWVPGWGGLTRLRRLIGESRAKEMIMLGERISATTALQYGLVNKICDNNSFDKTLDQIASDLEKLEPFVFEMSKKAIMDHNRTTSDNDLIYDAIATYYSKI